MTGLDLLRADLKANRPEQPHTRLVVLLFRLASLARGTGARPRPWSLPIIVFYKFVSLWCFGIDLPVSVQAGPGLRIQHGFGIVIHPRVRLGSHVILKHGVTLGIRSAADLTGAPTIGDGVIFGPAAQVLGRVTVGAESIVGAGAIVLSDVPPRSIAIGVPAKVRARSDLPEALPAA